LDTQVPGLASKLSIAVLWGLVGSPEGLLGTFPLKMEQCNRLAGIEAVRGGVRKVLVKLVGPS
jgi:hypothetical protein